MSHKKQRSSGKMTSPEPDTSDSKEDDCLSLHLSHLPVTSPGSSHGGGRLTGIPRKIRDTCADWHNYIQEWNVLNAKGMQLISEIANTKISAGAEKETEAQEETDISEVLPEEIEELCRKLRDTYLSMEKIVMRFERMTSSLEGITVLESSYHDGSFTSNKTHLSSSSSFINAQRDVLFMTWPTPMFGNTSKRLLAMYQKELALKQSITETVAHCNSRDILMVYTTVWIHQPYIEMEADCLLEGMLQETGLR